jgi:hypothetical protein
MHYGVVRVSRCGVTQPSYPEVFLRAFKIIVPALWCVLLVAACASPQVAKVVPPREDCAASEAVPATLEDFISHPDRLMDKCIHVRGFVAYRAVVPDLPWFYVHHKPEERVALYGVDPPGRELWGMRAYADITGYAYSCEQFWAFATARADQENEKAKETGSKTESIPFIGGECHYHGGPLLWVSQIRVDDQAPNRLFGLSAAKYASLTPMLSSAPYAAEVTDFIAPIFDFIRKQDKAGLEAHLQKIGDGGASSDTDHVTDAKQSPFAFLLGANKAPDVYYFVPTGPGPGAVRDYEAIGCVCKINNCDGKWPIAEGDARNNPDWPYACVQVSKEDFGAFVYLY